MGLLRAAAHAVPGAPRAAGIIPLVKRMRLPASVIIAAVGFLLPAAAGAERAPVLQTLNAQRAAHGIPAGITENPAWSAGCNAHENYMQLNGYFGRLPFAPSRTRQGCSCDDC